MQLARIILFLGIAPMVSLPSEAVTFSNRASFEAATNIAYKESFQGCTATSVDDPSASRFTGPLDAAHAQCSSFTPGLEISSETNNLFMADANQSTNPSIAMGSNFPRADTLSLMLGGTFDSFGVDIFQNDGIGFQTGGPLDYFVEFLFLGSSVASFTTAVFPNGGSFFGYIGALFDTVTIANTGYYEVIDDVTVGHARQAVPEINGSQLGIGFTLLFSLMLLYRERNGFHA